MITPESRCLLLHLPISKFHCRAMAKCEMWLICLGRVNVPLNHLFRLGKALLYSYSWTSFVRRPEESLDAVSVGVVVTRPFVVDLAVFHHLDEPSTLSSGSSLSDRNVKRHLERRSCSDSSLPRPQPSPSPPYDRIRITSISQSLIHSNKIHKIYV